MAGIRALVIEYPMLYAITREGSSRSTQAFALEDPAVARAQLANALHKLRADIKQARAKLGKELDPLDLTPLHEQLIGGTRIEGSGVTWSLSFPKHLARDVVKDHKVDRALSALALESASQLAFMFGSVLGGAGGGVGMLMGLAFAGIKGELSAETYQAMLQASKTAVSPDTELVTPAQVDEAKARNDADQAALALAVVNTAVGIAGAASGWAGSRIAAARKGSPTDSPPASAKALEKPAANKPSSSALAVGDAVELNPLGGGTAASSPAIPIRVVRIDRVSGDCVATGQDPATGEIAILRINIQTGNGMIQAGTRIRTVSGWRFGPDRPLLGPAARPVAPQPAAPRITSIEELPENVRNSLNDRPDALNVVTKDPAALALVAKFGERGVKGPGGVSVRWR